MTFSTFKNSDVTLLLKDISGLVEPLPASVREPLIQSGRHYSEMLPLEYAPSAEYLAVYRLALERFSDITASSVRTVAEKIYSKRGRKITLVSLARAGIPIGILIKRYLEQYLGVQADHYALSIIRDKGLDQNAMKHILRRHEPETIQFVDGWTGKGTIKRELEKEIRKYPGVDPSLAVLSDPAGISGCCGTHEDYLIASSCLNSTVSGLISRTVLRSDIIGPGDYHGVAFYKELIGADRTYEFIESVESCFGNAECLSESPSQSRRGVDEAARIALHFGISNINLVKPGVGEATRVLLRRIPEKVLVRDESDNANLGHIFRLAHEKGVEVIPYPLESYRACGLIREMPDC